MKIVYEKSRCHEGQEVFACCDKCKEPTRFFLGYTTDNIQNSWKKEEHKFCEKCGSFMDWDSLDLSDVENYEKQIRSDTIDECLQVIRKGFEELLQSPWANTKYLREFDLSVKEVFEVIDHLILRKDIELLKENKDDTK